MATSARPPGGRTAAALLLSGLSASLCASADCPPPGAAELLDELQLSEAFRTEVMGLAPPIDLYRRALEKPGTVAMRREGKQGQAALVASVPLETYWMAVNDDDHHADGDYIPLRASKVLSGEPAGSPRRTFQYFERAGIGRWWVNRLEMNLDLYRASKGRLWELSWHDVQEEFPGEDPPVEIDASVPKLKSSLGAWVLVPLTDECTLVEYTTRGEPGGMLGAFQFLVATRAMRKTLEGMLEMARDHAAEPHGTTRFVRPDGSPIDEPPIDEDPDA